MSKKCNDILNERLDGLLGTLTDKFKDLEMNLEYVNCPVCDVSPRVVFSNQVKSTRYVKCLSCGTVYASPRFSRPIRFSLLDESFKLGEYALTLAESRRELLKFEASVIKGLKSKGKLLDIGCSTGGLFEFFKGPHWQLYGVELSPSAAAHAENNHGAKVHAGVLQTADFPDHHFDVITAIDMFCYVDDPRAELLKISRLIRSDGLLGIEIPGQSYILSTSRGPLCFLVSGKWARMSSNSAYLYWYSAESLRRLLHQSGFDIIKWEVLGSPTNFGVRHVLSSNYYHVIRWAEKRWHCFLNWAPKIFCLAVPNRKIFSNTSLRNDASSSLATTENDQKLFVTSG